MSGDYSKFDTPVPEQNQGADARQHIERGGYTTLIVGEPVTEGHRPRQMVRCQQGCTVSSFLTMVAPMFCCM